VSLSNHVHAAAEMAARQSYGKLLAWLSWQWRNVSAAEDALSEAFASALKHWPQDGVPESPEGWLFTAAKRNLLMAARRQRLEEDPGVLMLLPELTANHVDVKAISDERLRLLFVCAHPAIDSSVNTALMLQLVLGIDAARIANVFLLKPSALSKRLTRAKEKIRVAGIPFSEPESSELRPRIGAVLEAIYGAYTVNDSTVFNDDVDDLADEALFLAQLMSEQIEDDAEVHGLYALLLYRESRKRARLDEAGTFIPLDEQDSSLWLNDLIHQAEFKLARAAQLKQAGPYQIEAAIQAAHMQGVLKQSTLWREIVALYEQLLLLGPTVGAKIGHAIAVARATDNPAQGIRLLDEIKTSNLADHQPWWAARASLLAMMNKKNEAQEAYMRAITLTRNEAVQTWLRRKCGKL
jgi:RNA polymerase sigma-70 factor (ECF subfamily)